MLASCANARGLAAVVAALRPQDVFATSLYTGTGAARSVALPFAPDLSWLKVRSDAKGHGLFDRVRAGGLRLDSSSTAAEVANNVSLDAAGFSFGGANLNFNASGDTLVGWSIKEAPKFFDIVTYTGDGTSGRAIPHSLGIKPGMVISKARSQAQAWTTWHRGLASGNYINLNTTGAQQNTFAYTYFGDASNQFVEPTDQVVTVGSNLNSAGVTYVLYLFAHDPDTTNGIVQCESFTTDVSGNASFTLPWPIQWIMSRLSSVVDNWSMFDTARGLSSSAGNYLLANTSSAEAATGSYRLNGNTVSFSGATANASGIFMAIRAPIT